MISIRRTPAALVMKGNNRYRVLTFTKTLYDRWLTRNLRPALTIRAALHSDSFDYVEGSAAPIKRK
jgi:hypothetical protein